MDVAANRRGWRLLCLYSKDITEVMSSYLIGGDISNEELQRMAAEYEERANNDRARLAQMMLYGQIGSCRWKFLLDYFGDETAWERCGHCDNCLVFRID
jgi:superfamily II DNA helicase RecQ